MPHLYFHLRQSPASLLLLGLLSLLLWGQCAFNPNGSSPKKRPAPNLHLHTAVRVVHIDSASTKGPDCLYLTLALQNLSDKPCRLAGLGGILWLGKQRVGYISTRAAGGTELPARGEQTFAVALAPLPPPAYSTSSPGTGFKLLRTAWQQGKLAQYRARLEVSYAYYPADGKVADANQRFRTVPLGR